MSGGSLYRVLVQNQKKLYSFQDDRVTFTHSLLTCIRYMLYMLEVSFASLSSALAGIASSGRSLYNGSTHKSSSSLSNASSSLRVVAKLACFAF
jgi:hypothetical protein